MHTQSDLASLRQCPRAPWLEHQRNNLLPKGTDPNLWRRASELLNSPPGRDAAEVPCARRDLRPRRCPIAEGVGYRLQETKASTFPLKDDQQTPKAPKSHHLDNVAIQLWVYQSTGFPLAGVDGCKDGWVVVRAAGRRSAAPLV